MKLKLKVGQTEKEYEGTWDEIARFQYFEEQDKTKEKFMDEIEDAVYGDLVTQKIAEAFTPEDEN